MAHLSSCHRRTAQGAGAPQPVPRDRLAFELIVLVAAKLVLLLLVWQLWFSDPLARDMRVAPATVGEHLLGAAGAAPAPAPAPAPGGSP